MAKFRYSALKNNKEIVSGEVEALDYRQAREKIRQLGFLPTKVYTEEFIDEQQNTSVENIGIQTKGKKITRLSLQEKIMFTSKLEVLLASGIPILEALHIVEANTPKEKLRIMCKNLQEAIMNGATFAEALSALYGNVFGPVYIGLVTTGETSGELDITLGRMLILLRKEERIKDKIRSASIYPAILIAGGTALLILFSTKIFPAFLAVLQYNAADIPIYSQMLIGFCEFVGQFWWLVLMGIGAFFGALSVLFQNPFLKAKLDAFVLKVPVLSNFIRYINLANFMTVLRISYDAGVPIVSGLELSNKTVGNYTIKKKVFQVISLVRNGRSLSESFEITDAIPQELVTIVATGEKSGTLGKMFKDAADVIDKKLDMTIDTLTRLFEPTLIIIMGIAVGFVAIAFYQLYTAALGSVL